MRSLRWRASASARAIIIRTSGNCHLFMWPSRHAHLRAYRQVSSRRLLCNGGDGGGDGASARRLPRRSAACARSQRSAASAKRRARRVWSRSTAATNDDAALARSYIFVLVVRRLRPAATDRRATFAHFMSGARFDQRRLSWLVAAHRRRRRERARARSHVRSLARSQRNHRSCLLCSSPPMMMMKRGARRPRQTCGARRSRFRVIDTLDAIADSEQLAVAHRRLDSRDRRHSSSSPSVRLATMTAMTAMSAMLRVQTAAAEIGVATTAQNQIELLVRAPPLPVAITPSAGHRPRAAAATAAAAAAAAIVERAFAAAATAAAATATAANADERGERARESPAVGRQC